MLDGSNITYLCDGSFYGLLSCVFYAFENKCFPLNVECYNSYQRILGNRYIEIDTDVDKSKRVYDGLCFNVGEDILTTAYMSYLSEAENKYSNLFYYICFAFREGANVNSFLTDKRIFAVIKSAKYVGKEAHLLKGFVRFTKLEQEIFYSDISPINNVLEILADHFSDRLNGENWVIHDVRRKIAAVYNKQEYAIVDAPSEIIAKSSENELDYRNLWKIFTKSVTIESRRNPKLQRQMMPKRFWKHMTEMKL